MFNWKPQLPERHMSSYMRIQAHVTPRVVILNDGSVLALYQVDGVSAQTCEDDILRRLRSRLNHAICGRSADDGLVLYSWVCRGFAPVSLYPTGRFQSNFAREVDRRYRDKLFDKFLYLNRTYVGVMLRPPRLAGEWVGDQMVKRSQGREITDEPPLARIQRLLRVCNIIEGDLAVYKPKRLGLRYKNNRVFTEIGEALIFAMTGIWRSVGLQEGRQLGQLFSERLIFAKPGDTFEIRGPGMSEWGACFGAVQMPYMCPPGTLDGFLSSNFRCTIAQSFRPVDRNSALTLMGRDQNRKVGAGDRAGTQIRELDLAMNEVQAGRMMIGDHNMTVTVFTDSLESMSQVANDAWHTLQNAGCQVAREDIAMEGAYFAMLPGNGHLRPRPGAVTSWNYAALAGMHAFSAGEDTGHWGDPFMMLRTTGGTPYRLHLHVNQVANVFLYGEAGSGKTSFIAFLVLQCERMGVQVVLFDKDRGLELLVRRIEGSYLALDNPTGVAPLKALTDSPEDIHHLAQLYRGMVAQVDGYTFTAEEDRRLFVGLRAIMSLPPDDRWLADLRAFMGTSRSGAGARLERYCYGNEYGWVTDNPKDILNLNAHAIAFDVTKFLDDPIVCGPLMLHLLYRTDKLADGRKFLQIVDEGWRIVQIPAFSSAAMNFFKVDRKRNAGLIFATQTPGDGLNSAIGDTIREQCKTIIGFGVERPNRDHLRQMRYTDRECEIVENLQIGQCLISQGRRSTVAQLALDGMPDIMSVLSGNSINVNILDKVRAKYGDDDTELLFEKFHAVRTGKELVV
jgi:type IV secretion system protein VirB4